MQHFTSLKPQDPDDIIPSNKGIKLIFSSSLNAKIYIQKIKEKGIYPLLKATGLGVEKSEISSSELKDFFIVEIDKKDCFTFFESQKNRDWFQETFHDQDVSVVAFKNLREAENFAIAQEQNEIVILKNSHGKLTPEERERTEFIVTYSPSTYQEYENKRISKGRLPEARWRLAKGTTNSFYEVVFNNEKAAKDFIERLSNSEIYDTDRGSVNKNIITEYVVRFDSKNSKKLFKKLENFESFVSKEQQYGIQLEYLCKFIKDKFGDVAIEKIIKNTIKSNKVKLQEIIKIVKEIYKTALDELQYTKLFEGFITTHDIPSLKTVLNNETDTSKEVTRLKSLQCSSKDRLDQFITFAKEREEDFFGGLFRKQDSEDMLKAASQLSVGMQQIQNAELQLDKELAELSGIFSQILDFEELLADIAGGDERCDNIFEIEQNKIMIKDESKTTETTVFFHQDSSGGILVIPTPQPIGNSQQTPFNGQPTTQGYYPNQEYMSTSQQQQTGYHAPIHQQASQQYSSLPQFVSQHSNFGGISNFYQAAPDPQAAQIQHQQNLQHSNSFAPGFTPSVY